MPSSLNDVQKRASFICICAEKRLHESSDNKLQRAFQSLALKRNLESFGKQVTNPSYVYQPGGGIVFDSKAVSHALDGCSITVFAGSIENYAYLVKKYCLEEAGFDVSCNHLLETIRQQSLLTDAEVVSLLYKKLGATFMSKIKGTFVFTIYDARLGRVLAVNDSVGTYKLWQSHMAEDGSLIVGCDAPVPRGRLDGGQQVDIGAGQYKFGWRSAPIAYMAARQDTMQKSRLAMKAAMAALAGSMPSQPSRLLRAATSPGETSLPSVPSLSSAGAHSPLKRSSYVPPHLRSSVDHTKPLPCPPPKSGPWRHSMDGARPRPISSPVRCAPNRISLDAAAPRPDASGHAGHGVSSSGMQSASWRAPPMKPASATPVGEVIVVQRSLPMAIPTKDGSAFESVAHRPDKLGAGRPGSQPFADRWDGSAPSLPLSPCESSASSISYRREISWRNSSLMFAPSEGGGSVSNDSIAGLPIRTSALAPVVLGTTVHRPSTTAPTRMDADLFCDAMCAYTSALAGQSVPTLPHFVPAAPRAEHAAASRVAQAAQLLDSVARSVSFGDGLATAAHPLQRPVDASDAVAAAAPAGQAEAGTAADTAGAVGIDADTADATGPTSPSIATVLSALTLGAPEPSLAAAPVLPFRTASSASDAESEVEAASGPSVGRDAEAAATSGAESPAGPSCAAERDIPTGPGGSALPASTDATQHAADAPNADGAASFAQDSLRQSHNLTPDTPASNTASSTAGTPSPTLPLLRKHRTGSFPDALASLLRGRSSPSLAAAAASAAPHPSPLSQQPSLLRVDGRASRSSSQLAQPGMPPRGATGTRSCSTLTPVMLAAMGASAARGLSPCSSVASIEGTSVGSLTWAARQLDVLHEVARAGGAGDSGPDEPSSPRASLPSSAVVHKLPAELLDELAGGSDAEAETKAMLASLLYSSPCALSIVDVQAEDQPVVYVNAIFELKTGYRFEEVVGRNCRFLQAPPGGQRTPKFATIALKRSITLGRSHTCKLLNFAKDGTALWNQLSVVPVRTREGRVTHYVGMQTFSRAHQAASITSEGAALVHNHRRVGSVAWLPGLVEHAAAVHRSSSHTMLSSHSTMGTDSPVLRSARQGA